MSFSSQLCAAPGWPATRLTLNFSSQTLSGTQVALPSTNIFTADMGLPTSTSFVPKGLVLADSSFRTECAFTQQTAHRVIDMTRAWLQVPSSTPQMC
jgi:hypothetical protein